ncbi:uncharacterized protein L3040_000126 [Drepanopeziza brunnea f. sp. 'multigermtubi']|uniref:ferric-chelate reductase (NADPH) n=1 Tax=Marssonina brunnea f. sp. multigermtubi (strain MB_m1) TaxID=1072389 RepID=K1WQG5_MARBU|nr:metalloreductase [Drepanopeziza brunnea f. sp. 'multigermtubi' MB_m1]EKD14602.1 metalloreductase [Drepanopeziza brunnea f. sp. 'multigermtubi' MB_m1]KAJ5053835.1 hypothetical protein L3040_000126 [Drepanopeziza brunnea f. sp. 'multigermtubi']
MPFLVARQQSPDDSMGEMSMGGMTTTAGVPGPLFMQGVFWAFVGAGIGLAVLSNILNKILCYQRISASWDNPTAAQPKSIFFKAHAIISALVRDFGYYSIPLSIRNTKIYVAPLGPATILAGYLVLLIVCSLYGFDTRDVSQWEDVGHRAGHIAICQIPLIVLLAAKRNIIGQLTGLGYERLAWLHRWVARSMLLAVLIHAGFFLRKWGGEGNILSNIKAHATTPSGIAAFAVLLWMIITSCAPIRRLSYEVFVVQHILSWLGFLAAVYLHVPAENQKWTWISLAFWGFDRIVRAASLAYINLGLFHQNSSGFLSCKATFEPLDESHTRVTIMNPPVTWEAGQHLFLACHVVAPLASHPFTISSLPSDGKIEFVIRAKGGATKRFFKYAEKSFPTRHRSTTRESARSVLIDGPYSRIRPLRQFDSVILLAGSTGATFTIPLMRDLMESWKGQGHSRKLHLDPPPGIVTRYVRFIWVVKKSSSVTWFGTELDRVIRDMDNLQTDGHHINIDISIYVTSKDDFAASQSVSSVVSTASTICVSDENLPMSSSKSAEYVPPMDCEMCRKIRDDENAIMPVCDCATRQSRPQVSRASSAMTLTEDTPVRRASSIVDKRINIFSGRPHVSSIIQQVSEVALGEMAVVVCGPQGLVQTTRNAAAKCSIDRGVHKGTGAQGIYVHAETFGYA